MKKKILSKVGITLEQAQLIVQNKHECRDIVGRVMSCLGNYYILLYGSRPLDGHPAAASTSVGRALQAESSFFLSFPNYFKLKTFILGKLQHCLRCGGQLGDLVFPSQCSTFLNVWYCRTRTRLRLIVIKIHIQIVYKKKWETILWCECTAIVGPSKGTLQMVNLGKMRQDVACIFHR